MGSVFHFIVGNLGIFLWLIIIATCIFCCCSSRFTSRKRQRVAIEVAKNETANYNTGSLNPVESDQFSGGSSEEEESKGESESQVRERDYQSLPQKMCNLGWSEELSMSQQRVSRHLILEVSQTLALMLSIVLSETLMTEHVRPTLLSTSKKSYYFLLFPASMQLYESFVTFFITNQEETFIGISPQEVHLCTFSLFG